MLSSIIYYIGLDGKITRQFINDIKTLSITIIKRDIKYLSPPPTAQEKKEKRFAATPPCPKPIFDNIIIVVSIVNRK